MLIKEAARNEADNVLHQALGAEAGFRSGQWEAIAPLLDPGARRLVVQRTGWGKSVVYFVASRLLRDAGRGPTLLVSPLLSLMRNQLDMAARFGLRAFSLNSSNREDWDAIEAMMHRDEADVLLISPERLANERFRDRILPKLLESTGLLVIDEAHCISDWGHDFRPDYRRILRIVEALPKETSILGTTATANERVIADIQAQLGASLVVQKGGLMRTSLKLSVFSLADQAERLAWLAKYLPKLPGTGIVYTLTVNDATRVAAWLQSRGIAAQAYHAAVESERRIELEQGFAANEFKALCATTALGMGYDKADVGFVVHFQRPGSIIGYYQQIGRAGRSLDLAYAVLLSGVEDDEISEYFIETAFPGQETFDQVLAALQTASSLTAASITARTNSRHGQVEKALQLLEVEGVVVRQQGRFTLEGGVWEYAQLRSEQITEQRRSELFQMQQYVEEKGCRMQYLAAALDDATATACGKCDNCLPHAEISLPRDLIVEAIAFLRRDKHVIKPRAFFPPGFLGEGRKGVPQDERLSEGLALCVYNDAGWGALVRKGKYETGSFSDDLIAAAVDAIKALASPPEWVCWVPSMRKPIVEDLGRRLAHSLGIPAIAAAKKRLENKEQKLMQNATTQFENVWNAFEVDDTLVNSGVCLLVDDVVDSGWTLTAIGIKLRRAGCSAVIPFALATAKPRGDD
ncbi:MAG: RecQ family ATP-dependent DNA helicase [Fimbriimonadaceae bacterium]